jgi:hypothetical protein
MSRAGQSTFTGISDQADIALLYLLRAIKKSSFQKIIIEGQAWNDFTLIFDDHIENCEVKSFSKELNYSDIKTIISTKKGKDYGEKDVFRIIMRLVNKSFKRDHEYIRESLYWWHSFYKKDYSKNSVIRRFLKKGWSEQEIIFLLKTEIVEFKNIQNIYNQVSEYFALEEPFYLDAADIENISSRTFKTIMEKGKKGETISRSDFLSSLSEFRRTIAEKSESFSPDIPIGIKFVRLAKYLKTEDDFAKLNHSKFLGPISDRPRLIFYVTDKLGQNEFNVESFGFFLNKILLKQWYVRSAIRLLEKKQEQNRVSNEFLIDFLTENYRRFAHDFNYDSALRMIKSIAQSDKKGKFEKRILDFMKREILLPFSKNHRKYSLRKKRPWREDEQLAEILKIFLERAKNRKDFMDFIFGYFDFTSDDFDNVIETHPLVYSFVKDFIKENLEENFDYVVRKISEQFNLKYDGKYKGYEWMGSGVSQAGSSYSIVDKGVVRLLFEPLFTEFYQSDAKKAWRFFKTRILNRAKVRATKHTPIYLKRALTTILLDRLEKGQLTDPEKKETFEYLGSILRIRKGVPQTSEIIFDKISRRDLKQIGYNRIMDLIEIDALKYRRNDYSAGYPTNLFVISTLIKLIKEGYKPAKDFYLALVKKSDFITYDRHYDSFEQMVAQGIPESDPDFIAEIFNLIDFETYLDSFGQDVVWDKSGLISGLIKKDWQDNKNRGQQIVTRFLKDKTPSKKVLEFLAGPIRDLAQYDAGRTYNLLYPYLQNKHIFWKTFQNSSYARENIVSMAEDLVKARKYEEAKHIIELCIDDPDPNTDEKSEFNYHLKIKNGEEESLITSVRGKLAWALQKFVISNKPKLMQYALEKTNTLLDLDGTLAKKLNYSEPDLYVRRQALVPFIELSHPGRRKLLGEDLSDYIRTIAFEILGTIDKQITSGEANPVSLIEHLVHVFSYIRDVSTDEAKEILNFFEYHKISKAHFLFVYFAVYRKNQYEKIPFDSKYFEEKLIHLCQESDDFRESLAWDFWRTAENDKKNKTNHFDNIEKYWKLLFEKYDQRTFDNLYRTLEITLTDSTRYKEHRELLKGALKKEIEYLKTNKIIDVHLWDPGKEIFQILKEHGDDDFLDVFGYLVENLSENIDYCWMKDWIAMFKAIKLTTKDKEGLCNKIKTKLEDLYPEYLEEE